MGHVRSKPVQEFGHHTLSGKSSFTPLEQESPVLCNNGTLQSPTNMWRSLSKQKKLDGMDFIGEGQGSRRVTGRGGGSCETGPWRQRTWLGKGRGGLMILRLAHGTGGKEKNPQTSTRGDSPIRPETPLSPREPGFQSRSPGRHVITCSPEVILKKEP